MEIEIDTDNENGGNSSNGECVVLSVSPCSGSSTTPTLNENETPKRSTSKVRLSKAESEKRKTERDARRAEEEAARAERKRLKDELKAQKAEEKARRAEEKAKKEEEIQLEKARRAEELQLEKARRAEELQLEKARRAEEKAKKEEELQLEKARKAEEKAKREAEYADKKAELNKKKEQKQAAAQRQELLHKQMANYMDKFFKPIEKSSTKDNTNNTVSPAVIQARSTEQFDHQVSSQDTKFVSDLLETLKSMKRIEPNPSSRVRLNSDSNSNMTTTNSYLIKTRYIHFPEKYFNRPPYYGSFKKGLTIRIDPLKPEAPIDNIDYNVDSESEWEEPCKDGEELRSEGEDEDESEGMDSDSDTDSFIVPHGHLSDDELNEDEKQQSTLTKQVREVAKSHDWNKKVARRNQQRELKPIFACVIDPSLDEKNRTEALNYLNQFRKILVPKEVLTRADEEENNLLGANNDETTNKEEKAKRVSKKKSLILKKGLTGGESPMNNGAKRTGSASNIVEGASPSKRRKMNSNENCSTVDDSDVLMLDLEALNSSKGNVLEDTSNVTEMKSASPIVSHYTEELKIDNSSSVCTVLVPKRKQAPV